MWVWVCEDDIFKYKKQEQRREGSMIIIIIIITSRQKRKITFCVVGSGGWMDRWIYRENKTICVENRSKSSKVDLSVEYHSISLSLFFFSSSLFVHLQKLALDKLWWLYRCNVGGDIVKSSEWQKIYFLHKHTDIVHSHVRAVKRCDAMPVRQKKKKRRPDQSKCTEIYNAWKEYIIIRATAEKRRSAALLLFYWKKKRKRNYMKLELKEGSVRPRLLSFFIWFFSSGLLRLLYVVSLFYAIKMYLVFCVYTWEGGQCEGDRGRERAKPCQKKRKQHQCFSFLEKRVSKVV